jgi:hypothetical protein
MSIFNDSKGKASMMRRISYMLIITAIVWGTAELIAYMILTKHGVDYDVHTTLISSVFGMGIAGKFGQKWVESKTEGDV